MRLRDQFKSTPEWKHKDPAVRIAALEKISAEHQEEIAALAREDDDPGVRMAAVRRLVEPGISARRTWGIPPSSPPSSSGR